MGIEELELDRVSRLGTTRNEPEGYQLRKKWPPSNVVEVDGCFFRFVDKRLVNVEIYGWDQSGDALPVLWDTETNNRYTFPLSQDDIDKLIGSAHKRGDAIIGPI